MKVIRLQMFNRNFEIKVRTFKLSEKRIEKDDIEVKIMCLRREEYHFFWEVEKEGDRNFRLMESQDEEDSRGLKEGKRETKMFKTKAKSKNNFLVLKGEKKKKKTRLHEEVKRG